MPEDGSEDRSHIPYFIKKKLENPPLHPGESARDFNTLFRELEYSPDEGAKTAADYEMIYQATILIWNLQRNERMLVKIVRHFHPAAVAALLRRVSGYGDAEPGSVAYKAADADARDYFTSEELKERWHQKFDEAGYGRDAIETEAFQQALPQIAIIQRQIAAAQRQLMAFLKEIERRNARRAEEFRKVARNAVSRTRAAGSENGAKN
ncbi:MAG TPA: hypothetical protein VKY22_19380 [Bradyrhizobium sp.]|nr:hypothetical protein [Bradyrhizobium sp.]